MDEVIVNGVRYVRVQEPAPKPRTRGEEVAEVMLHAVPPCWTRPGSFCVGEVAVLAVGDRGRTGSMNGITEAIAAAIDAEIKREREECANAAVFYSCTLVADVIRARANAEAK